MIKYLQTDKAPPSFSNYSQAVEVPADNRIVAVSGQVGVDLNGQLADTAQGQHEQTWRNIFAILAASDMGPENIINVTAYLTSKDAVGTYRDVRDQMLQGAAPASTLLIIDGLADPAWQVEISVLAAG